MNNRKKLTARQQAEEQQQVAGQHLTSSSAPLEFGSAEELLRHDALHTPVPPGIAVRLEKSIRQEPSTSRPWWRRFFGGAGP